MSRPGWYVITLFFFDAHQKTYSFPKSFHGLSGFLKPCRFLMRIKFFRQS